MRFRNHKYIVIIFLILCIIFIPSVSALIIAPPLNEQPLYIVLNLIFSFIITTGVEFCIIYIFLRSHNPIKKKLFYSVGFVNLVLFPPTNMIIFFIFTFYIEFFPLFTIIIGFLMVLLEWLLYRLEFQKLFNIDSIREVMSIKKTFFISTLANFTSFGVIYLFPVIMIIQQFILYPDLYSLSIFITLLS